MKNLKNGRINIKLNNIKKSTENLSKSPIPKIKSKSTKRRIKIKFNNRKYNRNSIYKYNRNRFKK